MNGREPVSQRLTPQPHEVGTDKRLMPWMKLPLPRREAFSGKDARYE
jgi:hypothetical protein